jgi:hypothetical protein
MYEDPNSEWKLEVQSRESRSIQCQPIYGSESKVILIFNLFEEKKRIFIFS